MFAVLVNNEVSRFFSNLKAARKWADWLKSQPWASEVRILAGGVGGMEVR
jgi:hypothetical protein